jgi:hypothetical protein
MVRVHTINATRHFAAPSDPEAIPDTFQRGRRCATAGCPTILSIYNPSGFCYAHRPAEAPSQTSPPKLVARDTGAHRECITCHNIFPLTVEHFYRNSGWRSFRHECKTCHKRRTSETRRRNQALYPKRRGRA